MTGLKEVSDGRGVAITDCLIKPVGSFCRGVFHAKPGTGAVRATLSGRLHHLYHLTWPVRIFPTLNSSPIRAEIGVYLLS